ncbi:MAG: PH domain-containing protein, partial [Kangiellaceae bacterium]|nr:PH domain-containing protein [Kangiellaceae bacterium]
MASEQQNIAFEASQGDWKRLSPISILFFLSKVVTHLIKDALPGLAPLIVIIANADNKVWLTGLILTGLGILILSSAVLQFWFYRFNVQENKILINEGVFKKKQRILGFERIQNINIIQPFYFKLFSLVTLQLETAGSKGNEADLAGISRELAEEIKQTVLTIKSQTVENEETLDEQQEEETNLLAICDLKHLIQYGVTSNGMFWFLVFIAPFMGMLDEILEKWIGEENIKAVVEYLGGGVQGGIFLAVIVFLTLIFGMLLFSILGAIVRYYNYELTLKDNTLKRHSGFLSTHEESAKLTKIQAFVIQTNFVGKWLSVENVVLKQASGQTNQQSAKAGLFVIPTRTKIQSKELLNKCLEFDDSLSKAELISRRYILKNSLIWSIIPIGVCSVLYFAHESYLALLPMILSPVLAAIFYQRWKNFRYQIGRNFGVFRSGFFGYKKIYFPLFKAQRVIISQSLLQKRAGLANLTVFLASERVSIPYIPMSVATDWFDR